MYQASKQTIVATVKVILPSIFVSFTNTPVMESSQMECALDSSQRIIRAWRRDMIAFCLSSTVCNGDHRDQWTSL